MAGYWNEEVWPVIVLPEPSTATGSVKGMSVRRSHMLMAPQQYGVPEVVIAHVLPPAASVSGLKRKVPDTLTGTLEVEPTIDHVLETVAPSAYLSPQHQAAPSVVTPHEWFVPAAMLANDIPPVTRAGTICSWPPCPMDPETGDFMRPSPICPIDASPQQYAAPDEFRPQECAPPVATAVKALPVFHTVTGEVRGSTVPSPS